MKSDDAEHGHFNFSKFFDTQREALDATDVLGGYGRCSVKAGNFR